MPKTIEKIVPHNPFCAEGLEEEELLEVALS